MGPKTEEQQQQDVLYLPAKEEGNFLILDLATDGHQGGSFFPNIEWESLTRSGETGTTGKEVRLGAPPNNKQLDKYSPFLLDMQFPSPAKRYQGSQVKVK